MFSAPAGSLKKRRPFIKVCSVPADSHNLTKVALRFIPRKFRRACCPEIVSRRFIGIDPFGDNVAVNAVRSETVAEAAPAVMQILLRAADESPGGSASRFQAASKNYCTNFWRNNRPARRNGFGFRIRRR
jgi:hypothetical protein